MDFDKKDKQIQKKIDWISAKIRDTRTSLKHNISQTKMSSRKKIVSGFLIIIGIIVAIPFNYMYGIDGIEVDLIWVVIGLLMASFGVYTLKRESKV